MVVESRASYCMQHMYPFLYHPLRTLCSMKFWISYVGFISVIFMGVLVHYCLVFYELEISLCYITGNVACGRVLVSFIHVFLSTVSCKAFGFTTCSLLGNCLIKDSFRVQQGTKRTLLIESRASYCMQPCCVIHQEPCVPRNFGSHVLALY